MNQTPAFFADYASRLATVIGDFDWAPVHELAQEIHACWQRKHTVFICGNGGSAANATHIANDLVYGIAKGGIGMKAHALSANPAIVTCLANDLGYEHIFSHQVKTLAHCGDILLALSGSGNSSNILSAIDAAVGVGMKTYAILGYSGGKAKSLVDTAIHFQVDDMQIAEDLQLMVGHMVMQHLCQHGECKPCQ